MTTERSSWEDQGSESVRPETDASLMGASGDARETDLAAGTSASSMTDDATTPAVALTDNGSSVGSAGGTATGGGMSGRGRPATSSPSGGGSGLRSGAAGSPVTSHDGDRLGEAAAGIVGRATDTIGRQADRRLGEQLDRGGDMLDQLAEAVRETGTRLRGDQPQLAGLADAAAAQADSVARYLREHDAGDLVREVEHVARRQPVLFVGGAFLLGALAARFLKASPDASDRYASGSHRADADWRGYGAADEAGWADSRRGTAAGSTRLGTGAGTATTGTVAGSTGQFGTPGAREGAGRTWGSSPYGRA